MHAGRILLALTSTFFAFTSFAAEGELLGVLNYQGGFVQRLALELETPKDIHNFRMAIPEFCQGVEIVEAGTVTEGIEELAARVDASSNVFSVNGGSGRIVRTVFAMLNGPANMTCSIPVFADATPTPSGCQLQIYPTSSLATAAYPRTPGWNAATVERFAASASWGAPQQEAVSQDDRQFLISQEPRECYSYVLLRYDSRSCGSNFQVEPAYSVYVGEAVQGTAVSRLYGFISSFNQWNVCVTFQGRDVRVLRTGI